MRKPSKKVIDAAIKKIEARFMKLGAAKVEPTGCDYGDRFFQLNTKGGLLRMVASDHEFIHCVFDDVEAAKRVLPGHWSRLNPYSGKWNWHFYVENIDTVLEQFELEVTDLKTGE